MKKVLVTGGAGFVGRRMCKALLDRGDQVICVDNLAPSSGGQLPTVDQGWPLYNPYDYEGFIFHRQDCKHYFLQANDTDFDEVYHLAAIVGGRQVIEYSPLAVAEDLSIDSAFWQWASRVKPKMVVCFSSSAVYPLSYQNRNNYCLLVEDMIDFDDRIGMPDLSYGWAKLTHEYLARLAYDRYGLHSVIYRPFSGYGEDQDLAYPFSSICRRVIESIDSGVVELWGSGEQMRDFIYIDDCIEGVLSTMYGIKPAHACNLSTGKLTSFKNFAQIACRIVGSKAKIITNPAMPEGAFARGGDTALQTKLGFAPKVSLEEGLDRGLAYQCRWLCHETC